MPPRSTTTPTPKPQTVTLTGVVSSVEYHIAKDLLTGLVQHCTQSGRETVLKLNPCCDLEYNSLRQAKKMEANLVEAVYPNTFTIVENGDKREFLNLEMLVSWTKETHGYDFVASKSEGEYTSEASDEFQTQLAGIKNPIAFMSVKIDGISAGKMYIELLAGKCPKTVAQFLTFVKQQNVDDPNYLGSCFTRLVENGWIQGGEIEQPEDAGPVTAPVLPDENFVVPHDRRGTISLVNKGPNSGVSSFMFMLASSMPYFNRKYVAFGRVIEGDDVLRSMERVDTRFERPCVEVKISDVGIWEKSFAA